MSSRRTRLWRSALGVGKFSAVQALVQILSIVAGIVWVRVMPQEEYAVYALLGSVLALSSVLSDLGAGSSLQHFFHRHEGSVESLSRYVVAVRSLRRWLGLLVLPILVAVLGYEIRQRVSASSELLILFGILALTVFVQQESSIRLVTLRLLGRWGVVYRTEVLSAVLRAVGALFALFARLGSVVVAMVVNLVSAVAAVAVARLHGLERPPETSEERREVLGFLRPIIPDTVYYALQGQIVIWIAALAGGSGTEVAEVGALARISLLFVVPQNLALNYFVPRLAGLGGRPYLSATIRSGFFLLVVAAAFVLVALLVPGPFLALLGSRYRGLERELLLIVASGGAALVGSFFAQVNRTRGWTRSIWVIITLAIVAQLAYASRVPLGTTIGALGLGLVASCTLALGHLLTAVVGFAAEGRKRDGGQE